MSTNLQHALEALAELPEDQQEDLAERFQDMVARAKIDAKLAHSEARGGAIPHDQVMREVRAMLATEYGR